MKHTIKVAGGLVAAAALAAAAATAHAGCADPRAVKPAQTNLIPAFIVAGLQPAITLRGPAPRPASKKIVGTWLATYQFGGKPFGQALIQWHDDGTEWENINLPVESGNICVGSWEAVDAGHVRRFHVGWLYTAGVLSGYFTETEKDTVAGPDQYSGIAETKIFDLDGHVLAQQAGTSSAVRIGY